MPPEATPTALDAFAWFHQQIPAEWNWVFAGISIIAFILGVIAMPSVLQMAFGRPLLTIKFETETLPVPTTNTLTKFFAFSVFNEPIDPKLKRFFVKRETAEDVRSNIVIRVANGGTIVMGRKKFIANRIEPKGYGDKPLIAYMETDRSAFCLDHAEQPQALTQGVYEVRVLVTVGEEEIFAKKQLNIGPSQSMSFWLQ